MRITDEEKKRISDFFDNNQILSECFIQLYEYQCTSVENIEIFFRENLIGFAKQNEKLRVYVAKSNKDGNFYIKIRVATSHRFLPAEMINYQSDIDKNNRYYTVNKSKITLKSKENVKKIVKDKNVKKTGCSTVKFVSKKDGGKRVIIQKISVNDVSTIIGVIEAFKQEGINEISVRINSKS